MLAAELKAADLLGYPPEGRARATDHVELLRRLPFAYVVVLLRELMGFDWKFPAERRRLEGQLGYLAKADPGERMALMRGFDSLRIDDGILRSRWAADPSGALEQLTAWLWSSHQMDAFRQAAEEFAAAMSSAVPAAPAGQPRLGIVAVGQGAAGAEARLFRKLRPHGIYLNRVRPENGFAMLLGEARRRASASRGQEMFAHWYIDGGVSQAASPLTEVSYDGLREVRRALLRRTQEAIDSGSMGPERLRTLLAQIRPDELGLGSKGMDTAVLDHFQVSLLTEGSGTQIFSTTFVQWAARECLRRAEPETLLLRYAPRQQQQTMNQMLSGHTEAGPDPEGSLTDADMGAYYTWLNLRRLSGADQVRFLAWFEGHRQAVVIGPGLPAGTTSDSEMDLDGVLKLLS
ncbi:MAG: hypothetical protein M3O02_12240 [Acidobacteriota bacterium]|nr:hypothetical protein [Acidobacteriota bacterium]